AAARAAFEKALDQAPDAQSVLRHLGNLWQDLNEPEKALDCLDRALALDPADVIALNGRGLVHTETRRFEAAAADYGRVLAMRPDSAEAHKRQAILRLLQGDYANGWADYEASLRLSRSAVIGALADVPYWQGEDLHGRRILLSEPNGIGDTLQFMRLISRLRQRGAEVAFFGPARLLRLLRTFPEPVEWLSEINGQRFDYQAELWSLPHWLGLSLDNIPADIQYLTAEPVRVERWSAWLQGQPGQFRVGVCWQGNPARKIDVVRSVPLRMLQPLAAVPGVQLVSLQAQHGLEQLDDLPDGMTVIRPPADFDDGADAFLDTAALMQSLDLVVTIDSALTHLAGALRRPVWLALRSVPEFRWMLDRSDSPWYPSVRLFRQQHLGDWTPVYQAMAAALQEAVSQNQETRVDS
ncbi:MAG: tetratricopeptide repeat protein, partial [Xanthomonadales bacterium]|nr:tetratricopeptide repeat protein [Xanthomonadales bacterium]